MGGKGGGGGGGGGRGGRAGYLEGVQLLPREAPRHHLPQNDTKGVDIGGLTILMLGDHLQEGLTAHNKMHPFMPSIEPMGRSESGGKRRSRALIISIKLKDNSQRGMLAPSTPVQSDM